MRCITVLYPNREDIRFDFDYYRQKHATLILRLYGKAIARYELRRGVAAADGGKPAHVAIINFWIADQQAFDAAQARHAAELIADVPNFTNGQPIIQIDEVLDQQ